MREALGGKLLWSGAFETLQGCQWNQRAKRRLKKDVTEVHL
jgi:hypothetical protein